MADCFKYHEMISCLIDGQLSPDERKELDQHLSVCEGCRALLDIYALAFSGEMAEPPRELISGSMLKVRAKAAAAKRHFRKHLMRYAAAAACFALIVAAIPHNTGDTANPISNDTYIEKGAEQIGAGGCEGSYMPGKYSNNDYFASVTINGQLPELLKDYVQNEAGDGSFTIKVRSYMIAYLDSLGYTPTYNPGSESDWSLVIYNP